MIANAFYFYLLTVAFIFVRIYFYIRKCSFYLCFEKDDFDVAKCVQYDIQCFSNELLPPTSYLTIILFICNTTLCLKNIFRPIVKVTEFKYTKYFSQYILIK